MKRSTSSPLKNFRVALVAASALAAISLTPAQAGSTSVTSDSTGFFKLGAYDTGGNYLGLLANSDTMISLPFTRSPEFFGTVASVSNNIITVAETPNWTTNQFVYNGSQQPKTYYLLIGPRQNRTSAYEGRTYTVTANSDHTLTVLLNGDTLRGLQASTQVSLIPYWTLASLFPNGNAGVSFTASPSPSNLQTQVLIPNTDGDGTNLAPSATYFFLNGSNAGWKLAGDSSYADHGDDILAPDSYLIVRNVNGAPTLPLIVAGNVLTGKWSIPLATQTAEPQDNPKGIPRPVDIALQDSGLSPNNHSFVSTASTKSYGDLLYVYDNAQVGINKAPSSIYYYMSRKWRMMGDALNGDHGKDRLPAGVALKIVKAASRTGLTAFWTNDLPGDSR